MGVSIDTYDKENGIHPRNKQLSSKRLAVAGLNLAYGMKEYPLKGPFPLEWNFAQLSGGTEVNILYDQPFVWKPLESEGFYVCTLDSMEDCNSKGSAWQKVTYMSPIFIITFQKNVMEWIFFFWTIVFSSLPKQISNLSFNQLIKCHFIAFV